MRVTVVELAGAGVARLGNYTLEILPRAGDTLALADVPHPDDPEKALRVLVVGTHFVIGDKSPKIELVVRRIGDGKPTPQPQEEKKL